MSLRQSQKWWKKVPEKYLAPEPKIWGTGGPMDPYDRPYTRKDPKEDNMAVKVTTQTTSVADMDPKLRGPYIPRAAPKAEIRSSVQFLFNFRILESLLYRGFTENSKDARTLTLETLIFCYCQNPLVGGSTNYLTQDAMDSVNRRARDVPLFSSFSPDYIFRPQELSSVPGNAYARGASHGRPGTTDSPSAGRRELGPPRQAQNSQKKMSVNID